MCKVSKSHEVEAAERQSFLLGLQQYGNQIQRGISVLLQVAQEANIRSDASLDNMAVYMAVDNQVPISADPTEKDDAVQYEDSLVRRQSTKRNTDDLRTVDGQPVAMQGNHLFQVAHPLYNELRNLLTAVALLNDKYIDRDRIRSPCLRSDESRAREKPRVRRLLPFTLSPLKTHHSCRSVLKQALTAYKHEKNLTDKSFLVKDVNTWKDVRTEFHQQPSTLLSGKISRITSNITGVKISNYVDFTIKSNTHMAVAWSCVKLMLNVTAVCSTSYCKFSEKIELSLCSRITPIWPKSCWRA